MLDCIYNTPTVAKVKRLSLYPGQFSIMLDTKRVLLLLSPKKYMHYNLIKLLPSGSRILDIVPPHSCFSG